MEWNAGMMCQLSTILQEEHEAEKSVAEELGQQAQEGEVEVEKENVQVKMGVRGQEDLEEGWEVSEDAEVLDWKLPLDQVSQCQVAQTWEYTGDLMKSKMCQEVQLHQRSHHD